MSSGAGRKPLVSDPINGETVGVAKAHRPLDVGTHFAPCSPSGEVLPSPNPRRTHGRSGRAAVTAGTLGTERYAVDGVAADPAALDTHRDATYLDDVEHADTLDGLSEGHKSCSTSSTPLAEPVRLAKYGRCCNCSATIRSGPGGPHGWPWTCPACGVRGICIDYLRQPEITTADFAESEALRQGRLRRWQATR